MVQIVNALGSKTTRGASFMIPCPVCHKRRQARRTWYNVRNTRLVVCPDCAKKYEVEEVKKICERQGWITVLENYNKYLMSTMYLRGVSL